MGDFDLTPRGARTRDVKWLDPAGYRRWRGRHEQRDVAFADGLYGTGLRLTEWASVLVDELPGDEPGRGYSTCRLADASAKGGYGHPYWLPRQALLGVLDYLEGARARAVRGAPGPAGGFVPSSRLARPGGPCAGSAPTWTRWSPRRRGPSNSCRRT